MIVHHLEDVLDALKKAYYDGAEFLFLDLNESLDSQDIFYAWFKCYTCHEEVYVTLGEEIPKKCWCGGSLQGFTADIIVKGDMVLYNEARENPPERIDR